MFIRAAWLDSTRMGHGIVQIGVENAYNRRLSAPDMSGLLYLRSGVGRLRLFAGSMPKYNTAQAEIGRGRSIAVFSAPGFFHTLEKVLIKKNLARKSQQ